MNPYALPPFISCILAITIGCFVLSRNVKSKDNITFSLLCFSTALWLAGYTIMYLSTDSIQALRWARVGFSGIIFIPIFAYHFVTSYIKKPPKAWVFPLLYGLGLFSVYLGQTNYVYSGISRYFWGFYPDAGPIYFIFPVSYVLLFSYATFLLFLAYLQALKAKEYRVIQQLRYVFIAIGGAIPAVVDYIIKYKIEIYPFGYISALFFIFVMTYAIVKTRLMDIEFVIKRSFVYSVLTALIIGIYTLIIFVSQEFFGNLIGIRWVLTLLGSAMIAIGFKPLETAFTNFTDKYFFQGKYDYHKVLKDLSRGMAELTSLERLTKLITRIVMKNVKLSGAMLFVYDYNANLFRAVAAQGDMKEFKNAELVKTDNLVRYMDEKGDVLIKGEVAHEMDNNQALDTHRKFLKSILNQMNKFKAVLCVPSKIGDKLMGFILLSEKKSQDAYSTEDLMLFQTLAPQAAIAMKNAMTYDEIRKDFEKEHEKVESIEKQLERSERLASLGTVAAGVAHEIRNPLGMIQIKTDKLAVDQINEETLKEFKASVTSNIERSTNIIRSMLDLAKSKEKKYEKVDLNGVIESALQFFPLTGIKLVKELGPISNINGDAEELKQVLVNLIDNAVKAMPTGGNLKVVSRQEENRITIDVTDTGVGIPKEDFERIFDPFFSTRHEGTGLGLSIAYRIIREHGGSIKVESKVGEGSTFQLQFTTA